MKRLLIILPCAVMLWGQSAVVRSNTTLVGAVIGNPAGTILATVNGAPGACGDSTHIPIPTINAGGQVTSCATVGVAGTGGTGVGPYVGTFTGTTATITAVTHGQGTHPFPFVYDSSGSYAVTAFHCKTAGGATVGCADPTSNGDLVIGPVISATYGLVIYGSTGTPYSLGFQPVTFSATPTFNAAVGNVFKITLTGNVTSSTLSGAVAGQPIKLIICQNSAGNWTFVWPTNMNGTMVIGTTASKCSSQSFSYDGTTAYAETVGVVNQ